MKTALTIFQIIICIALSALIFLQSKGSNENNNILSETSSERRGWEKILFNLTMFIILLFLISSIVQTLI
ncbi:MAG TPA: preprotein translocase subunit SecG [Candidatus Methanoperedens sp.]|nr:preprotein translocase subunit SecG [Candidatus Methanoperedens sp.]